jgi:hypothetical protein
VKERRLLGDEEASWAIKNEDEDIAQVKKRKKLIRSCLYFEGKDIINDECVVLIKKSVEEEGFEFVKDGNNGKD